MFCPSLEECHILGHCTSLDRQYVILICIQTPCGAVVEKPTGVRSINRHTEHDMAKIAITVCLAWFICNGNFFYVFFFFFFFWPCAAEMDRRLPSLAQWQREFLFWSDSSEMDKRFLSLAQWQREFLFWPSAAVTDRRLLCRLLQV